MLIFGLSNHIHIFFVALFPQDPKILISLYNSALDHIELCARNSKLSDLSWPIPELSSGDKTPHSTLLPSYWNDQDYVDRIGKSIDGLKLPNIKHPGDQNQSWSEVVQIVFDYFDQHLRRSYCDCSEAVSRLRKCLTKSYHRFERQSFLNESSFHETLGNRLWELLPWVNLVQIFIDYRYGVNLDTFFRQHYPLWVFSFLDSLP